ncbi:MAG TPA: ABC transporter ATP-binding protein [Acidimicrobiia bacterium]|nr:ABC transporter ATP-binding protein [Acidimicrobiia bacterium]
MLEASELTLDYGAVRALDHVDLEVPTGDVLSVLGPSGSGKSTLLRVIAGLEPGATGSVRWSGEDLSSVPTHRRQFGLMFQDHMLFAHRDVVANVEFGLRMHGASRRVASERARRALTLVGLAGYESRRTHELSGGEQQRVALARAIAPEPRLLLLDEPFGSLDRALRDRLLVELRELFTELGITAVFVTHDHDEAFAIADHVLILRAGRAEQLGDPVEVWRAPATEFTARFLGFVNTIDVDGDRLLARADGIRIGTEGTIEATVTACTFRRDHFLVTAVAGSARYEITVSADDRTVPSVGDTVMLEVDERAARRYPPSAADPATDPSTDPSS